MKELFDMEKKLTNLIISELDSPHSGLIEEALGYFFLNEIGEVEQLKAIYDDAKKRIKVY